MYYNSMSMAATLPVETKSESSATTSPPRPVFDPRIWLLGFISAAVWISASEALAPLLTGGAILLLLSLLVTRQSKARGAVFNVGSMMLWVLVAAVMTILLYAIFGPTTTGRVVHLAGVRITIDSLLLGVVMAAKLVALLLLSNVLLRCVSPLALATGISGLLMPLRHFGVPISSFFYLAFFLTRMIPNLLSESRLLALAQRSRGVPTRTWRAYPALALPMFASALRRSDSMAIVLTSRGFDTNRIPAIVRSLRFSATDYLVLTILTMGWVLWIYLRIS